MPKHTKKAKNAKNVTITTRQFLLKTEEQEYAQVTKMLGDCRVECKCFDDKVRLGIIRNKMRRGKANRIKVDDIVIVSLRDYQDDKADIIHVYTPDEVKRLKSMNEIPNDEDDYDPLKDILRFTNAKEEEDDDLIDLDFI